MGLADAKSETYKTLRPSVTEGVTFRSPPPTRGFALAHGSPRLVNRSNPVPPGASHRPPRARTPPSRHRGQAF